MSPSWVWRSEKGDAATAWLIALCWTVWWWRGLFANATVPEVLLFFMALRIAFGGTDTRQVALVIIGLAFAGLAWLPAVRVPTTPSPEAASMVAIWAVGVLSLLPWPRWIHGLRAAGRGAG